MDGAQAQPEHPEPDLRWVHRRVASQGAGADSILVQRFFFACVCDGWMDATVDDDATDEGDGEGSERMGCISRDLEIAVRTRRTRFETRFGISHHPSIRRPRSAAVKTKQSVALVSGYPDARDRRGTRRAMTGDGTNAMRSVRVGSRRRRRAARTTRGGTETRDAIGIGRRSYQGCISVENQPKKTFLWARVAGRARVAHIACVKRKERE